MFPKLFWFTVVIPAFCRCHPFCYWLCVSYACPWLWGRNFATVMDPLLVFSVAFVHMQAWNLKQDEGNNKNTNFMLRCGWPSDLELIVQLDELSVFYHIYLRRASLLTQQHHQEQGFRLLTVTDPVMTEEVFKKRIIIPFSEEKIFPLSRRVGTHETSRIVVAFHRTVEALVGTRVCTGDEETGYEGINKRGLFQTTDLAWLRLGAPGAKKQRKQGVCLASFIQAEPSVPFAAEPTRWYVAIKTPN